MGQYSQKSQLKKLGVDVRLLFQDLRKIDYCREQIWLDASCTFYRKISCEKAPGRKTM